MQRLARKAIAEVLNQPEDPASAIVTINPANGDIEAMAESESYEQSQYNLAADGHRQPGSTFKAIDLADALSRGVDPNSTYYVSHTLAPGWLPRIPELRSEDVRGRLAEQVDQPRQATLKSDNTVYAQLAADLGEETITADGLQDGRQDAPLQAIPREALGGLTLGVTPLEMADVYATLADGGWRNTPIAITKVVFPDGHVDSNWGKPHRVKVLSEARHRRGDQHPRTRTCSAAPRCARRSTARRPPRRARPSELVDAWLDGYNSEYATVVWMGYPNKRVSMTDVHGEPQQGGYLPAEIWHAYMAAVTEGQPCAPLHAIERSGISYQPFYGKYATHRARRRPPKKARKPKNTPARRSARATQTRRARRSAAAPRRSEARAPRRGTRRRARRPTPATGRRDRRARPAGAGRSLTRRAGSLSLRYQRNERPSRVSAAPDGMRAWQRRTRSNSRAR